MSRGSAVEFGGSVSESANVKVNDQPAVAWSNNLFSAAVTNLAQGSNTVTITATDGSGNAATNQYRVVVSPSATVSLGHDPDGNMLTNVVGGATYLYAWDAKNRLTRITRGGDVTEFLYDGLDRRIRIVELSGGVTNAVRNFLWAGLEIAEERDAATDTVKRFYPQGFQTEDGQTENFYFTRDHLGSIREITDNAAATRAAYAYDPWGRVTKTSGGLDSDFLFTGHFCHQPSGLHLAPYRAYSMTLGRWLSRDPINEAGGINLYAYVMNSPVFSVDPLGLDNMNLFAPGSMEAQVCDSRGKSQKEFSVGGHGSRRSVLDQRGSADGVSMTPTELADEIRNHPEYDPSKPVRLNSCSAGRGKNSFAEQLARELDNRVIAPDRDLKITGWRNPFTGKYHHISTKPHAGGQWQTFGH